MAELVRDRLAAHRGEYGFDGLLAGWIGLAVVGPALLVVAALLLQAGRSGVGALVLAIGAVLLLMLGLGAHTTRRGKFAVWAEILEGLHLRGDEEVLDVGCGRGAVLTMVARSLPAGRATGVDLWSTADQSGNGPDAAQRNVDAEGVSDRCRLVTGDMREIPFPDASFDLVTSSIAIHNVLDQEGRSRAIDEIARVLKPGGRVVIADLAFTRAYEQRLRDRGFSRVERKGLGWRFWWGPGYPSTSLLTASKPG